ncbi:MAG: DNA polymerase IV [Spirochaetes bacterium]|uniref:DNA polymerase IV n=1 Tax=Candidatus Ornithospirochaeta stercoripullorum TaxID=2840899 RepID=A0A9D9DZ80_9SPIO|nr:DNA polymerase IV [Candidatus Ornithospirochaeta stercoripullorum]
MGSVFFHIDLDAFFASVENLDHPEYRGKPLIIGTPGPRHVVSTCSYEARKYGVHSAMPMTTALKLCPNAICVPGRMKRYSEMSQKVMDIISSFAPGFLQVSIDEAFLNLTGMERIYPFPGKAAKLLKAMIKESTGLTVSIGVASSRYIAKLASDFRKPDGLTIVPRDKEELFIDTVGLKKLWGIGDSTYESLAKHGINSTQTLRKYTIEELSRYFGDSNSIYLYNIARGIDPGIYQRDAKSRSISTEKTFYPDIHGYDALDTYLLEMSQEVEFRAMEEKKVARTVGIKLRYGDFTTLSAQTTPEKPLYSSADVYKAAKALLRSRYNGEGVRLIGVVLSGIYDGEDIEQPDFFAEREEKERKLEKTILSLSQKGQKIVRARSLDLPRN